MPKSAAPTQGEGIGTAGTAAASRSRLYLHLSHSFAFPQPPLHADVIEGRWPNDLGDLLAALPYRLKPNAPGAWRVPADYDTFQSGYIRLFEVGPRGGAPCPLYGGHYARDRLRTMEELVRFYNFFGLRLVPGLMPDHVTVELEFMHFLTFQEDEARNAGGDVESCLRAQRDFLQRQLANWWPSLSLALKRESALPFYRSLVSFTGRLLESDSAFVQKALTSS